MTPEQLAIALQNTYVLEHWIKAVRSHAFDELKRGIKIPGFAVGYGIRFRIWKEGTEETVTKKLLEAGLTRKELFTPSVLLSPKKVGDLLKEDKLFPKKPRNGERPPSIIDPFLDRSMPEPKIVRVDNDHADGMSAAEEEFG